MITNGERRSHLTNDRITANVLVIGNVSVENALRTRLPSVVGLRSVATTSDTEGLGVDLVIVGGRSRLSELFEIRVHPQLSDKPVIMLRPGYPLAELDWAALNVHVLPSNAEAHVVCQAVIGLLDLELTR